MHFIACACLPLATLPCSCIPHCKHCTLTVNPNISAAHCSLHIHAHCTYMHTAHCYQLHSALKCNPVHMQLDRKPRGFVQMSSVQLSCSLQSRGGRPGGVHCTQLHCTAATIQAAELQCRQLHPPSVSLWL